MELELWKMQVHLAECIRCRAINTDDRRLSRSGEIAGAKAVLVPVVLNLQSTLAKDEREGLWGSEGRLDGWTHTVPKQST